MRTARNRKRGACSPGRGAILFEVVELSMPHSPPQVIRSIADLRQVITAARRAGQRVGVVPTMGALHPAICRWSPQPRASAIWSWLRSS